MAVHQPIPLSEMTCFAEGVDHPEGICQTLDGTIYVGGEAGQLYRVESDGSATELLRTDGFMLGLAADADGRVYAIDTGHKCVWRVDPATASRDVFATGPADRPFTNPNWGVFAADGTYYLSDSGGWGASDGVIWRVLPGAEPELWSMAAPHFPNGMTLSPDGERLLVLESYPGAIVELALDRDGAAGSRRVLADLDPAVPDGIVCTEDGGLVISAYRPDTIFRWHPDEGLSTLATDPRGTILAAPTNVIFTGDDRDEIVVPNIGRWHLTRFKTALRGVPLHYPTRDQLGD